MWRWLILPKIKKEKLNLTEKQLLKLGEVEKVHLPRDRKGKFVSKKTEGEFKQRPIKLVKIKDSYGFLCG
jgi:hypothetical protein